MKADVSIEEDFVPLTKMIMLTIMEILGKEDDQFMAKEIRLLLTSFSEAGPTIQKLLQDVPRVVIRKDDTLYLRIGSQVYSCEDSQDGYLILGKMALENRSDSEPDETEKTLVNALRGYAEPSVFRKLGYCERSQACVILFRLSQAQDGRSFRDILPLEENDRVVMMGGNDVALVLYRDGKILEDAVEFALAAVETIQSEAGITCHAGVGRPVDRPDEIPQCYREAEDALATGLRHRIPGFVFSYGSHMMERFADLIPEGQAKSLRKEIIQEKALKILNEEMLETVSAFFSNDLNLSTTARQLFIHRNTLIYRIEKIRKATGLDLRKFEDASVFRLMMCIPD